MLKLGSRLRRRKTTCSKADDWTKLRTTTVDQKNAANIVSTNLPESNDPLIISGSAEKIANWYSREVTTLCLTESRNEKFGEQIMSNDVRKSIVSMGLSQDHSVLLTSFLFTCLGAENQPSKWKLFFSNWFSLCLIKNMSEVDFGFLLFKSSSSDVIGKEEIGTIIRAFCGNDVDKVSSVAQVKSVFETFLEERLCPENFECYQKLLQILESSGSSVTGQAVNKLFKDHIEEGALAEVNISAEIRSQLIEEFGKGSISMQILKSLKQELKSLLDMDVVKDFLLSKEQQKKLVDLLFTDLGLDNVSEMTLPAFKRWTRKNASLLSFFKELQIGSLKLYSLLVEREKLEKEQDRTHRLVTLLETSEVEQEFEGELYC